MANRKQCRGERLPQNARNYEAPPQGEVLAPVEPEGRILGLSISKFAEVLIIVIAIPLLSYLAVKVTSLDTTVSSANLPDLVKGVTSTKDRLDILYQALPRMRLQIAAERANAPVHMAVVATLPDKDGGNAFVHVVDFDRQTKDSYAVPPEVARSADYALKLRGAAASLDDNSMSFANCQLFLDDLKKNRASLPSSVDQKLSFAITDRPSAEEVHRAVGALSTSLHVMPTTERFTMTSTTFDAMATRFSATPGMWEATTLHHE